MTDCLLRATTGHHSDLPCGFSRPHCAHRVAAGRVLDLDDLGAEVAEQLAAERAGQELAHLDDAQVVEGESRR